MLFSPVHIIQGAAGSLSSTSTLITQWHILWMIRSQKWKVQSCLGSVEYHTTTVYTHYNTLRSFRNINYLNYLTKNKELNFIYNVYLYFDQGVLDHLSNFSMLKFKERDEKHQSLKLLWSNNKSTNQMNCLATAVRIWFTWCKCLHNESALLHCTCFLFSQIQSELLFW